MLPMWPPGGLSVPDATPQKDSPCKGLSSEPRSRKMALNGKNGYWISDKTAICYLARSRVARACRPACELRVKKIKTAHEGVVDHVIDVGKKREKIIIDHHKKELEKRNRATLISLATTSAIAAILVALLIIK